jgi:hypothetical protein
MPWDVTDTILFLLASWVAICFGVMIGLGLHLLLTGAA